MLVTRVLGTRVDVVNRREALMIIEKWLIERRAPLRLIATAYSEFFVVAMNDPDFRMALEGSDMIVPDGIGPLAANYFRGLVAPSDGIALKFAHGLQTGLSILLGRVGKPVSGYSLFKDLTKEAAEKRWKVFILGGFGGTAQRVVTKLKMDNGELKTQFEAGAQNESEMAGEANERVIDKINRFKPDLLFVAYGPVKQEKWLAANKNRLNAGVALGVGGAFDEYLGKIREAPVVMERYGLKWLWRLIQQPKRIGRIWKAVVVFPWLVFREK